MITKRIEQVEQIGGDGYLSTMDEVAGTPEFCPAYDPKQPNNVCGRKMTRVNSWTWNCKTHGEMH